MGSLCRLDPGELVAYREGTLPRGRQEIVQTHLGVCQHCQERVVIFNEVDHIIQTHAGFLAFPKRQRTQLRTRLQQEANRQGRIRRSPRFLGPLSPTIVTKVVVVLCALLAVVPAVTQANFPLSGFVHFADIKIKQVLPLDAQNSVQHVTTDSSDTAFVSSHAVAPAELPLGLVQVERSHPHHERMETLYRNGDDVAILIIEVPAETGRVTLDAKEADLEIVRGTQVVCLWDPRPSAVSALFWERNGVFFEVIVTEAPLGVRGGLKQSDALLIVEAVMEAQDAVQK